MDVTERVGMSSDGILHCMVEIYVVPVPEENQMVRTLTIHPSKYLGK